MKTIIARAILALFLLPLALLAPAGAQAPEPRLALVLGNAEYRAGPLATAANDAGLIAETLRNAGFDVTGAASLDQDQTRRAFREFLDKANAAGPQAVIFVYLAGRGLQFEGENYFVPVDATIARDSDVPAQAVRISDLTRPLAGTPFKARIVVLDLARANTFAQGGQPLAPGLALIEPEDGSLIAFNTAPGTVAPDEQPPYGAYAQALSAMMREGGLPVDEVFSRTRLRVNEVTRGAEVPWHASKISAPFLFFERAPGAPALAVSPQARADIARRPIRDFPVEEAYGVAVERDTIPAYQEFLQVYPTSPLSPRVRALLAARREALIWRRCVVANRPEAYWTYVRRYPGGPHVADARRRLALISAPLDPPPQFAFFEYDVPPPPPEEVTIIDQRRTYFFDDPAYAPPPPVPVLLLGPRERERDYYFVPPPPPPQNRGFLPIPVGVPMPFARPVERQGGFTAPAFMPQPPRRPGQGAQPAQVSPGGAPGAAPGAAPQPTPAPGPGGQPGLRPTQQPGAQPAPPPGGTPPPGTPPQGARPPGGPAAPGAATPSPGPAPTPAKPLPGGPAAQTPPAPAQPQALPGARVPGGPAAPGTRQSGPRPGPGGKPVPPPAATAPAPGAPAPAAPPAAAPKPAAAPPAAAPPKPAAPAPGAAPPKPVAPPPAAAPPHSAAPPPAAPKPSAPPAAAPHVAPPPAAAPHVAPPAAPQHVAPPAAPKPPPPSAAPHAAPPAAPRPAAPPPQAPRPAAPPPPAAPHAAPPPPAAPHVAPPVTAPRPAAPPPTAPKPPPAAAAPHAAPAPGKPACPPGVPAC